MNYTQLEAKANLVRQSIIEMLFEAGSGHSAGPLGLADILTALYFEVLNIKPEDPKWAGRDRLVLSCGHNAPAQYATMAHRGYFETSELLTLRKFGSRLQGHPHIDSLPGIDHSSGPLGQGISVAIGMALAGKMDKQKWHTYAILSDGEHDEGQVWEGLMLAGNRKLDNLTIIVDRNHIQLDGPTEKIMPLEPLADKYRAFNFNVIEIDGHNFTEIIAAFRQAKSTLGQPSVIIAQTIPGKGVDFMEQDFKWHGKTPDDDQAKKALKEIRSLQGAIRREDD